jgi:dCTP deaminase
MALFDDLTDEQRQRSASDRLPTCYKPADGTRVGHGQWPPGLLCDAQIRHLAECHGMIEPFEPQAVRRKGGLSSAEAIVDGPKHRVVSYGTTSYGYDLRVADEFKVFTNAHCAIVDPKEMDQRAFVDVKGEGEVLIPPNSFVLARSLERFKIPRDVLAIVLGKSTYARCGLVVNCTPLEPEWCGYLTIEISNTTPLPARVYANEGIAQVLFFKASVPCATSYAEKNAGQPGKYQDQPASIITPRM